MSGELNIALRGGDAVLRFMKNWIEQRIKVEDAALFPPQADTRLSPDLSDFQKADLAFVGSVEEAPSGGRVRTHVLLSHFEVGNASLIPAHVAMLYLMRVSALLNRDFKIESIVGGASQTGQEAGTAMAPGNDVLAQERAAVVASWLVFEMGLKPSDVHSASYGSSRPLIDKSADPASLEEPLNRNVILTYSVKVPDPVKVKPAVVTPPPVPSACEIGSSSHWNLNLKDELAVDVTLPVPVAPILGAGGGAALRIYELERLNTSGDVVETKKYYAIGGGTVVDVDPTAIAKDIEKIGTFIARLSKIAGAALPLSLTSSTTLWATPLEHIAPILLPVAECLTFDNFDKTLMLTDTVGAGSTGIGASAERTFFPLQLRATAGVGYEKGLIGFPSIYAKRFRWFFFAAE